MNIRIAIVAGLVAAAAAGGASAAPASASANATANIVAPAALASTRDLDFGTIAKPTTGTTTVTVASSAAANQTPTVTGGNGSIPTPNQARAATFRLVGTPGQTYSVTQNALSFTNQAGNLSNVGSQTPVAAGGTVGTLPGAGVDDLFIGGHFDITPTTAVQAYTGTLALTVNFN